MRFPARVGVVAALALGALSTQGMPGGPSALAAQSLERVEALASEGRARDARDTLAAWWERSGESAGREDRQRGIWLRARLTEDADRAVRDYLELIVQYPGGPWTDRALLRVAQDAEARGDLAVAGQMMETLVRNHPQSPLREEARAWLGRNAAAVERARSEAAARASTARPPGEARSSEPITGRPAPDPPAVVPAVPAGDFTVQLGAFSSVEAARAVERRAQGAGLEPRLVRTPGSDLVRVRVGRFVRRAEADPLLARVRSLGLEAISASDASRETPVP